MMLEQIAVEFCLGKKIRLFVVMSNKSDPFCRLHVHVFILHSRSFVIFSFSMHYLREKTFIALIFQK